MAGNTFGNSLRVTTFGESHGAALGVVVDGLPAGLRLDLERVQAELTRRAPGGPLVSGRREPDRVEWLSGLLDGVTSGMPLAALVRNVDTRPADYAPLQDVWRPGHAAFSWEARFGVFDARGGGRASGRETVARVIAGAVARQALEALLPPGPRVRAFVDGVGSVSLPATSEEALLAALDACHPDRWPGPVPCPEPSSAAAMAAEVQAAAADGDSVGGTVRCLVDRLPAGLGEPVFDKLTALLGHGLLSLGGVRGLEFGLGFAAARMRGSAHNDLFVAPTGAAPRPGSNRAGGVLGGVSSGLPLDFRVAVKPASSIAAVQQTVDRQGRPVELRLPAGRHDPCIALRLPPVVEAITCTVLLELLLARRAGAPAVG